MHFLKLMLAIAWECFRHPFSASAIDYETCEVGRVRMCEMPRSEVDPNDREAMADLCKRATTSKLELTRERLNLESKLRAEWR